ncbi:hypothetical protein [Poseidonibacter ostreae]|jgi:hypothetical protein|uniref:GIY-YIG nuclease family protein n=1 Tax=Poseidonibacter ostreae TaxID=2654171 RepID=A0A6L4WRD6_9BACT|nr:hypothetical protein [Poseidonibacter ostreae]KAB7887768.1 hypothetical protein GBG19_10210 [Poseidonibacter ostreae]KAB7888227.1 hypothetical protein GA417_00125 [Poseidonibacter ostreae]KAB7890969.1 hypothetical protein GBG18_07845 [Poseidonibacter ostreae]
MKRSIGMKSSYVLTQKSVDYEITKISAGNFALGYETKSGLFVVEYFGRSDTDLNHEIKKYIDRYERFKFFYASSPKSAFVKECKNYHAFDKNKIVNKSHPEKPENTDYECPYCKQ